MTRTSDPPPARPRTGRFRPGPRTPASRRLRAAALGIAAIRAGAGIALATDPLRWLRWEPQVEGTSMPLLLRTVGIRDLVLGVGTFVAVASASPDDLRTWLGAGLVSDALDVGAGVASARTTGLRGASSALMALPVAALGAWALTGDRATPA